MTHRRKPRVLIIRNAFQYDFGGAETYALNLAVALQRDGRYEPILVTKVGRLLEKAAMSNIKTIRGLWEDRQGGWRRYLFVEPVVTLWYMLIMLIYRIDVVHAQGRDDFVFASRAAYWIGRRVIWTDHGDLKYIWSDAGPAWIGRKVMKALRYTSKVIVVSKSEYREIAAVCSDMSKFVVVHNGVFPDKISEAVENKEVVIGSTSRLVTAKGIGELIAAFEMIGNSKAKLRIIGDGFEARKFRKLAAASGKAEQIEFMGYRTDVADQLRSMDIFVHPSYHEAFCLSIIEAAMAGLPIVATNTGGNPEIVSPSIGRLVEVKNASSLAAAIEELIQDKKLRRRLGANAARLARRKFDFQKIVHEQVVPLYKGEAK